MLSRCQIQRMSEAERPFNKNNKTRHDQAQHRAMVSLVNQKFSRRELSEKSSFCPLPTLAEISLCVLQSDKREGTLERFENFRLGKAVRRTQCGGGTANSQNNPL